MHLASHEGYLEVVKWLAEQGADINVKDDDGMTPLDPAENRRLNNYFAGLKNQIAAIKHSSSMLAN